MLGQEDVTAENAIEVVKQEVGPCWSRWADDCLDMSNEALRERGLFADCERLIAASIVATDQDWDYVRNMRFCEGYFDYDRMPDGRGEGTGPSEQPTTKKKSGNNTALAVGAGVAVLALGLMAIA